MKVAIVTMEIKSGKCETNFQQMMIHIQRAKADKADMIVFAQDVISGYLLGDAWLDDDWCRYVDSFNDKLIALADDIAIVWGNLKYRRTHRFQAAFFAYQGQTHMRVKRNEDTALMADSRYFKEHAIQDVISFKDEVFALNFGKTLQLSDWNINLDCAPYDIHKQHTHRGNTIYVNALGMQNVGKSVVVMEGGSYICKEGNLLYQASYGKCDYALIDTQVTTVVEAKQPSLLELLRLGIKGFDEQVLGGKCPWIVGLSGGLDSSISVALLTYALGNNRIHGFNMASSYNSDKTISNAQQEASALDIAYYDGSIEPIMEATFHTVCNDYRFTQPQCSGLVAENMQARIRGHLLSSFASILGGVVSNNGNKVENALGYCTLYGDSIGALGVLGDLTKVQLFALAKELNAAFHKEVVPMRLVPEVVDHNIIWEMPPSAELRENQLDPMKWFYHDYIIDHLGRDMSLISFMKQYLDGSIFNSEVGEWLRYYGLDDPQAFIDDIQWLHTTMKRNSFKGLQIPPMITISSNNFATRQSMQGNIDEIQFEQLKQQILQK